MTSRSLHALISCLLLTSAAVGVVSHPVPSLVCRSCLEAWNSSRPGCRRKGLWCLQRICRVLKLHLFNVGSSSQQPKCVVVMLLVPSASCNLCARMLQRTDCSVPRVPSAFAVLLLNSPPSCNLALLPLIS